MTDDASVQPSLLGIDGWTRIGEGRTVVVPVGAFEQHGPHLPLDTDTRIAEALARSLPGVEVAPAIAYGASGEHEGFPGTVSLGAAALETVLVEYGRSACRWAARLLFVNGHGGNVPTMAAATALLRYEGRDVAWLPCAVPEADAHAGRTETSLLLYLSPEVVDMARAEVGNTEPISKLLPRLREGGTRAVSGNGVLGDPRGASASEGARILAEMTTRSIGAMSRWAPSNRGMLT
ncbi:mycofactocin biosynthesis peptidyl-dipeptidase MftE [Rhodococcus sp. G-MC3]|uniref:mycofactocin biosynthesis peptidyl-dipeptidase MftE n=1 Tax=Rhodococcus sp. G-MC3 TaxID=3046209 RepID=UPI0024BB69C1|nr:mycofactocin biosynthesis peptidyl-dipeptidase MftE [Rhodococcus sp. G-MC3]MDJ0392803.1 mycofactocin biosynthesis peptidyl-dipeptidase MftE [Rhodococcus sp. G-MC3]